MCDRKTALMMLMLAREDLTILEELTESALDDKMDRRALVHSVAEVVEHVERLVGR
jgi:hypothetical protein